MQLSGKVIATGHDHNGKAVFTAEASAKEFELAGHAVRSLFLWGRDDVASFPDDGLQPELTAAQPGPGGIRATTLTIEAGAVAGLHQFINSAMKPYVVGDLPGFHRTPTLDVIIVTDGEVTLELDEGAVRILRKGDTAILNGVAHRWCAAGESAVSMIAIQIGAKD